MREREADGERRPGTRHAHELEHFVDRGRDGAVDRRGTIQNRIVNIASVKPATPNRFHRSKTRSSFGANEQPRSHPERASRGICISTWPARVASEERENGRADAVQRWNELICGPSIATHSRRSDLGARPAMLLVPLLSADAETAWVVRPTASEAGGNGVMLQPFERNRCNPVGRHVGGDCREGHQEHDGHAIHRGP
jgi:hypothetical protein